MKKQTLLLSTVVFYGFSLLFPESAFANMPLVARGVTRVVTSVLAIPMNIIQDSTQLIFPLGILTGTVKGAFNMVTGILGGGLDVAVGAAPYAKYLVFFV